MEEKTNKPDFELFAKSGEKHWIKIGVGWKHEKGTSIKLNALPASTTLFLAKRKEQETTGSNFQQNENNWH